MKTLLLWFAIVALSMKMASSMLKTLSYSSRRMASRLSMSTASSGIDYKVAFMFPGQGGNFKAHPKNEMIRTTNKVWPLGMQLKR